MAEEVAGGMPNSPMDDEWAALESELRRITAVEKARVVGPGIPAAIHVVAGGAREPSDVRRDVVSVVIATTGRVIDPAIVSVVPVRPQSNGAAANARAALDAVVVATKQDSGWVKLRLRLPDGTIREGSTRAASTPEERAAAAVSAVIDALASQLEDAGIRIEMDAPALYPMGLETLLVVRGSLLEHHHRRRISGSAFVIDDTATAAARATLDALNRHLRLRGD